MSFKELWELLIKFINRIKPSVEAILVGAILAGLAASGDYLYNLIVNSGNGEPLNAFLTGQTVLLIFAGAFVNFVTSKVRELLTKRALTGQPLVQIPTTATTTTASGEVPGKEQS